jgi:5-methylthioadenosine/S-adenosylhomocysteine deaminase
MTAPENTPPIPVDLVIDARWIIPVEPDNTVLESHSLIVKNGRILDLLPTPEAAACYAGREHRHLGNHVLLPGLVNLHTHAAMTLLRGYADDLHLMEWLQEHIWPAEARHMSPEFVHDGTLLACWEMLRGGITCFNDMYFFPEDAARAALSAGIRAAMGITVLEFPSAYGTHAQDYLDKGLQARERLQGEPLISFCLAPHAPYTVAETTFERIATIATESELPVHIHLHETLDEIASSLDQYGVRPLLRLQRLGLVNSRLVAVHAVHLDDKEIGMLASSGCHVAHCPTSNMKLASGIAPVEKMLGHRLSIGLGTDGAASNNRLDMFQEIRLASLLAKVAGYDSALLPAHQALRMATLEGARALGLVHEIGSLEIGKAADLVAIELDDWINQPCFNPVSHIIYVTGRENVSHVWVNGKLRIDDKKPIDCPHDILLKKTQMWQNTLSSQSARRD